MNLKMTALAMYSLRLIPFLALTINSSTPVFAGVDDYPTSIAGCRNRSNPRGPIITADLKDAKQDTLIDPWGEFNRECTSMAAWRLQSRNGFKMPFSAYAIDWKVNAQALHIYTIDNTPALGSIAWWASGHVAWVEAINGTQVTIEEYNHDPKRRGTYSERTIQSKLVTNFIHFKDIGQSNTEPLYRLSNDSIGQHFYTIDANERAVLLNSGSWRDEGIACHVQTSSANGWVPFTRWRNTSTQGHLYTCDPAEINALQGDPWDWVRETDMGYVCLPTSTQPSGTVDIFRFCCDSSGDHFYTENVSEIGGVLGNGNGSNGTYRGEGPSAHVWP